jgi:parvulin-like peptidyl-prolyl isomerase
VIRPLLSFLWRRRVVAVFALVPIALAACSSGTSAATVGDAAISHERVRTDMVLFSFLSGLSGTPCGSPADGESADAACARFTLTNEIQEEMVKAYAATHDITVTDRAVSDAIEQLQQSLGGTDQVEARLAEDGLTLADLRALARRLLLFGEVQDAVIAERLSDDELRALYEESKDQFTTVEVHHILLEDRDEAEDVAREATPGNFARLARVRSIDPQSAENGGNLGSFSESQFRSQFDPVFVDAALGLPIGGISDAVETQFGFHVIYLARRDVATFEDVREQLSAQQASRVFGEWMRERYEDVDVEVNPRYGRLDRTTFSVVPVRSTENEPATPTQQPPGP